MYFNIKMARFLYLYQYVYCVRWSKDIMEREWFYRFKQYDWEECLYVGVNFENFIVFKIENLMFLNMCCFL